MYRKHDSCAQHVLTRLSVCVWRAARRLHGDCHVRRVSCPRNAEAVNPPKAMQVVRPAGYAMASPPNAPSKHAEVPWHHTFRSGQVGKKQVIVATVMRYYCTIRGHNTYRARTTQRSNCHNKHTHMHTSKTIHMQQCLALLPTNQPAAVHIRIYKPHSQQQRKPITASPCKPSSEPQTLSGAPDSRS